MNDPLNLQVTVDLGTLQAALRNLKAGNLPRTAAAVRDMTLIAQKLWLQAASGKSVTFNGRSFTVQRVSGEYARSISDGLEYPADGDPMKGRVSSNSPYARVIEQGQEPHDMKPGLLAGPRARMSKDGKRYNIIPFRHGTPNSTTMQAMPAEVYEQAKKLSYSVRTGTYPGTNADGQPVDRYSYKWGRRLGSQGPGALQIRPPGLSWKGSQGSLFHEYEHTTSVHSGMVRMGNPKHSSFMTFRVVSENSPAESWWHPGVEPKPVAQAVAQMLGDQAERIIRVAFEEDCRDVLLRG